MTKQEVGVAAGENLKSEAASFPSWIRRFCIPNWSLAACGDWPYYKEATTVSCWCLTCKSCWSKHTLCRGRQHRVVGPTGTHASPAHTLREQPSGDVQQQEMHYFISLVHFSRSCATCEFVSLLHANSCEILVARKKVKAFVMRTKI